MTADLERQLRSYCQTIDEVQGRLAVEDVLERTGQLQMVPAPHAIRVAGRRTWAGALVAVVVVLLIFSGIWLLPHGKKTPVEPANSVPVPTTLENPAGAAHNGAIITDWSASGTATLIQPPGGQQTTLRLPKLGMGGGPSIAWSPDGRHLAVLGERHPDDSDPRAQGVGNLAIVDTSDATSIFIDLHEGLSGASPDWSSDGSAILFGDFSGNLHIINTADWTLSPLRPDSALLGIKMFSPSWSPDGEWIAFSSGQFFEKDQGDIYKVRRDGRDLTLLASGITGVVDWSPTDDRIAVLAAGPRPGIVKSDAVAVRLLMVDADGGAVEVADSLGECFCIIFSPGLEWAPDGTVLALNIPNPDLGRVSTGPGEFGLYLIDPDGQNLRRLGDAGSGSPAWQPIPANPARETPS